MPSSVCIEEMAMLFSNVIHDDGTSTQVPFTAEEEAAFWARQAAAELPPPVSPREALRLAWVSLPVAVRAQFSALYAAVNLALDQDDKELAAYLVGQAAVPEELQAAKDQLLGLVQNCP
jgi:hypothetical protein